MMTNNCSFGVSPYTNTPDKTFSNQLNDVTKMLQNTLGLNDSESENFIHDFNIDSKKLSDTYHAISEQETNPILYPTEIIKKESVITGKIIGSGAFGIVYEHPENKNLVIKKITNGIHQLKEITKEADYFRKYYGEDAAKVILTDNDAYIEMLKIPGKMILDIPEGGFRFNAPEKLWEMIFKLDRKEIWHSDISPMNILYDYENNTFYPVDISNLAESHSHFELTTDSNDFDTMLSVIKVKNLLELIERNREC